MTIDDHRPLLTDEAFLDVDFGERIKAELEDGEIRVLARGPRGRAGVAADLLIAIHTYFRGSGLRTCGALLALKTGERSVRHPDVAVYDGEQVVARNGDRDLMGNPLLVAHVRRTDRLHSRLADGYRQIASLRGIVMADVERQVVRSLTRLESGAWQETLISRGRQVDISALGLVISHADSFATD